MAFKVKKSKCNNEIQSAHAEGRAFVEAEQKIANQNQKDKFKDEV